MNDSRATRLCCAQVAIAMVAIAACAVCTAGAQDHFETNGPFDGAVWRVYAAGDGTVFCINRTYEAFRSEDDGRNWSICGRNPNGTTLPSWIDRMAIDSSGTVYAGAASLVWRSTDAGESWTTITTGLFGSGVQFMQASRDGIVYMRLNGGSNDPVALFRSTNRGGSWSTIDVDSVFVPGEAAFSVAPDGTVFAGVPGAVRVSSDGGTTWRTAPLGLDSLDNPNVVFADRTGWAWVYISPRNVIAVSSDGGQTWRRISPLGLPPNTTLSYLDRSTSGALFASTDLGLYKSIDSGATWTLSKDRASSQRSSTAIAASSTGTLFCIDDDLFRSTDDGRSWEQTLNASTGAQLAGISRTARGTILACTWRTVYRSDNGGISWSTSNRGLPEGRIVGVLGASDGTVYIALENIGVYRSDDDGESWTASTAGLPTTNFNALTQGFGGAIFLSTTNGLFAYDPVKSVWGEVGVGLPVRDVKDVVTCGDALLIGTNGAGVFRSTDNGVHWSESNSGLGASRIRSLVDGGDGIAYLGTDGEGIWRSDDYGVSWRMLIEASRDLRTDYAAKLSVNGAGTLSVGSGSFLRSTDGGNSWTSGLLASLTYRIVRTGGSMVTGILDDPRAGLLVATDYAIGLRQRQSDSGRIWNKLVGISSRVVNATRTYQSYFEWFCTAAGMYRVVDVGDGSLPLTRLSWAHVPTDQSRCIAEIGSYILMGTTAGIYRYQTTSNTWTACDMGVTPPVVNDLAVRSMGRVVFAATSAGVVRSYDSGLSWQNCAEIDGNTEAMKALTTGAGMVIVAGSNGGLYGSEDDGSSWTDISGELPRTAVRAIAALGPRTLYVGTDGFGVHKSSDNGQSWSSTGIIAAGDTVTSLAVNGDGLLFAGTTRGVWRSIDRGAAWEKIIDELSAPVTMISVSGNGRIYVGSESGLYCSTTSTATSSVNDYSIREFAPSSIRLSPNPATDRCSVEYDLKFEQPVSIAIFDLLGRMACDLVRGLQSAGKQRMEFQLGDLPAGVYIVHLTIGSKCTTTPLVILSR